MAAAIKRSSERGRGDGAHTTIRRAVSENSAVQGVLPVELRICHFRPRMGPV